MNKTIERPVNGRKKIDELVLRPPRIFTKRDEDNFYLETETDKKHYVDEVHLRNILPKRGVIIIRFTRSIISKHTDH